MQRTSDGVIRPESTIWLGSLSRSQKAATGAIADDEWLSADPLPILPDSDCQRSIAWPG